MTHCTPVFTLCPGLSSFLRYVPLQFADAVALPDPADLLSDQPLCLGRLAVWLAVFAKRAARPACAFFQFPAARMRAVLMHTLRPGKGFLAVKGEGKSLFALARHALFVFRCAIRLASAHELRRAYAQGLFCHGGRCASFRHAQLSPRVFTRWLIGTVCRRM